MYTLIIRHVDESDPAQFQVSRLSDGKSAPPVPVESPVGFPVEGRPDSDLVQELRWYLETFLDYPFSPETEHADRVQAALKKWGSQAFIALFGSGKGRDWFREGTGKDGLPNLHLQVSSDDPRILAWPWEALHDPESSFLALGCQIERRLNLQADPLELSPDLPRDRVNILLVTARPLENDVHYRSISRQLVELIHRKNLPAEITVLRPPTLDRLREHLLEHPNHYHIVHFDGHGGYGVAAGGSSHAFAAPQGRLVFEDDNSEPDPITADKLSVLLREHRIPAVVLNACRSGMVDARAEDAFASVAASLVKAGIRSVVAMGHSLYVSGAQELLPELYGRLFEVGDVARATRDGRLRMYRQPGRVCARGRYPLQDWLVPVVYQQDPLDFSFAKQAKAKLETVPPGPELPPEAQDSQNPYGFIGRDNAVLELERALRRPPPAVLIHGLGGVGKTTLARSFLQWLRETGGLEHSPFWFTFNDIRTAEFVFNRLGETLFGANFIPLKMDQKIDVLARHLNQYPYILVWDNFESARGIEGTPLEALLSQEDQELLRTFLGKLRDGRTKVLITSRSGEQWLGGPAIRFKLPLVGLQGDERWEYCQVILRDLGKTVDQNDPELVKLMKALDGHPLMMRALLPKLETHTAASILAALQSNLAALGLKGDETQEKVTATLRFVEQGLPEELRPLLVPLGMHEQFVDAYLLEKMAGQADQRMTRERIDRFLSALGIAGLVHIRGQAIFELHPALTGFLRSKRNAASDSSSGIQWARAFVEVIGSFARSITRVPLHHQRNAYHMHGANFHFALGEAKRLEMDDYYTALTQLQASYALNTHNLKIAEDLFQQLEEIGSQQGLSRVQAAAYHQLGMVAEERRDFAAAQQLYHQSLAISEKHGYEHVAASSYHQLGMVAEERRDFDTAEQWYRKSLALRKKHGNEYDSAASYHHLGRIAEGRGNFHAAERWYQESAAIYEKEGDEHRAASSYHHLGNVAAGIHKFDLAEMWYQKSLVIKEKHGDKEGVATTFHGLGIIAEARCALDDAEMWYLKSIVDPMV